MRGRITQSIELQGNPSTRSSYRSAVRRYLDHIYGPQRKGCIVTREEASEYERLAEKYFSEDRNYTEDLQKFAASLNESRAPPKSAQFCLSVIKEFLRHNEIEIDTTAWRMTKKRAPKGRRARTREGMFSRELIQKIVPYMPVQTRAVFLVMLSSGTWIGETLQLDLEDIFLDEQPARIEIPDDVTKNGDPRTVFISREAVSAVCAWLDIRDKWLKSSVNRNNGLLKYHKKEHLKKIIENDNRIFPVHPATIEESFVRAL
jgi:integrase